MNTELENLLLESAGERLMDFTDEDFEAAEKVNSNSQLYKESGNSIVVNVLVAIMGQMIPGKEDVYKERV